MWASKVKPKDLSNTVRSQASGEILATLEAPDSLPSSLMRSWDSNSSAEEAARGTTFSKERPRSMVRVKSTSSGVVGSTPS